MSINRRRFCLSIGALSAGTLEAWAIPSPEAYEKSCPAFGTTVRLRVRSDSADKAHHVLKVATDEIAQVERLMSVYRPDSQLSQLNQAGILDAPHPMLVEIIRTAKAFARQTRGAFDITVQPLWELYRRKSKQSQLPTFEELNLVRSQIGIHNVDVRDDRIELRNQAKLTLNGIAQGFATERVKRLLVNSGIRDALVDCGELAGVGHNEQDRNWVVGLQHPREKDAFLTTIPIHDRCLATSGDYATWFTPDFKSHHIFDPASGRSPQQLSSVTVLADDATQADVMSTAFHVLGVEASQRILAKMSGVDAMFVLKTGRVVATTGFPTR